MIHKSEVAKTEVVNLSNPEKCCKALDKLDPIIEEAIKEFGLDAEDLEAVLEALKEKFRTI